MKAESQETSFGDTSARQSQCELGYDRAQLKPLYDDSLQVSVL
jgi:hypothetical protein